MTADYSTAASTVKTALDASYASKTHTHTGYASSTHDHSTLFEGTKSIPC